MSPPASILLCASPEHHRVPRTFTRDRLVGRLQALATCAAYALDALHNDGDILVTLDVLARQVGILGIFSDWSATVTYYANCMGLK
jgi:hypothetical protein